MTFCEEHNCAECCFEVDVPLLNEDIRNITSMGYYDTYFTENDNENRVKKLRKICGKCVFHNDGLCEVYPNRPERCKLYPLSYDGETKRVTLDERCASAPYFEVTDSMKEKMLKYIKTLRDEIQWRMKTGIML